MLLCGIGQCAAGDGICRPARRKDVGVVGAKLLERRSAIGAQRDAIARGVVCVGPHLANQTRLEDGLLVRSESLEICRPGSDSPGVQQNLRFPMQPIRAPVGCDIGAVTPDGADLLAADRLPHSLAIGDGTAGEEKLPVSVVHIGDGRSFADHLPADSSENGERSNDDDGQCHPITLVGHNFSSINARALCRAKTTLALR